MNDESRARRSTQRSGWDDPARYEDNPQGQSRAQQSGFERRRQLEEERYRQSGRGGEDWSNEFSGGYGNYAPQNRPYYGQGQYGYAAERDQRERTERDSSSVSDYGSPWDQRRSAQSGSERNQWGRQGMPDRASGRWEGSHGEQRPEQNWERQGMPDRSYGRAEYQQRAPRREEHWEREEDSPYYIGREGQPSYPHSETDWDQQRQYHREVSRFGDQHEHEDRWHRRPVRSQDFRIRSLPPQEERIQARREAERRRIERRDQRRFQSPEQRESARGLHQREDRDLRPSSDREASQQTTRSRSQPKRSKATALTRESQNKRASASRRKK